MASVALLQDGVIINGTSTDFDGYYTIKPIPPGTYNVRVSFIGYQAQEMEKVVLPKGYKPSESEEYMNPMQLKYFKQKLQNWRLELLDESRETLAHLKEENWNEADAKAREAVQALEAVQARGAKGRGS